MQDCRWQGGKFDRYLMILIHGDRYMNISHTSLLYHHNVIIRSN